MMYVFLSSGSLLTGVLSSIVLISADFSVLFIAPVIWQREKGTGVKGCERIDLRSRFWVTPR